MPSSWKPSKKSFSEPTRLSPCQSRRRESPQTSAGSCENSAPSTHPAGPVRAAGCFDEVRIDVRGRTSARSAGLGQSARQTAVREAPARSRQDHNRRTRKLPLRKRSHCRLATKNDRFGCGLVAPYLAHQANGNVRGRAAWGPFCDSCGCAATARR
jgi:hypothetical protein